MKLTVKTGDVLAWRYEGAPLRWDVLDVRDDELNQRAQLRVEGWLGTHWVTLTSAFIPWADPWHRAGDELLCW